MTTFNLPPIFVPLVGLVFSAIGDGFFISSCSKKQNCLDMRGSNLIRFFET